MIYEIGFAFLPLWILGVPLVVALISLAQLPDRRENISRSRSDVDAGNTPQQHTH